MAIRVRIPTPLRTLTQNEEVVTAHGTTISELIDDLQQKFPGIKERICNEKGELHRFLNIYLNDEDIRFSQGTATSLNDGDEQSIIPAIAGG